MLEVGFFAVEQSLDEGFILFAGHRAVDIVLAVTLRPDLVPARLHPSDIHVDAVLVDNRRDGIEKGQGIFARRCADAFRKSHGGQRTRGDDGQSALGQLIDPLAYNFNIRMFGQAFGYAVGEMVPVDRQRRASRQTMLVAFADDDRIQVAHFLVQKTDGIFLGIVGTKTVRAYQFGQTLGLVRRSHLAAAAHLGKAYFYALFRKLPGCFRSGEAAANDMYICHARLSVVVRPQCQSGSRTCCVIGAKQKRGDNNPMKNAFAESRPFLMLSLLFGISYFFVKDSNIPGVFLIAWKGAGVGWLAVYALTRLHRLDGKIVGAIMALGAIGDMALEFDLVLGAGAFMIGHLVAILFYSRYRRHRLGFSQKMLAIIMVPLSVFIAWTLPSDRSEAIGVGIYCLSVAAMAAMAWTSRFSRYQVGAGAMMFLISDLLIFARMGPLETSVIPDLLVWPLYYFGQFMIATGIVRTLRHEMAADSADPVQG